MGLKAWLAGWFGRPHEAANAHREAEPDAQEAAGPDPFDPFPEPIVLELTDVFDLHAIAPRDVKRAVEEYLLQARELGFRSVRIIHGKGVGVQRQVVQSILARTPFVTGFADAPPEAGGWGATIAHLTHKDAEPES